MDNRGKMEKVRRMLQFDGLIVVDSVGKSGGLALLWKLKEQVKLRRVKLYNVEGTTSDHSPILLVPGEVKRITGKRIFCFENALLTEPICKQLVTESWELGVNADIQAKIKHVSDNLFQWGQEITGKFSSRIKSCKVEMRKLRKYRDTESLCKYDELKNMLHLILDQREIFWRQRSKQLWFHSGDKNGKYFPVSASVRRRNNQISCLKDGEATRTDWLEVVDCMESKITAEQNVELFQQVSELEVRTAIFQMDPDKSPGPDGMTPAFYQKHWSIVGPDVVHLVREFFNKGTLPDGLNDINVVVIPRRIVWCVTSVKYTITHGAKEMGPVMPSRGLRQGDPLSPYLFILCVKGLSALLHKYESQRFIQGVQVLQMREADESVKYMGLPNLIGRNKSGVLGFLKDKMKNRVSSEGFLAHKRNENDISLSSSWKKGWVSQAGREVLIKNVAQAMATYAMSLFLLPLEITRDFERTLSRYWWGEKGNAKSGIHWMCWDRMSKHKLEGKQGWRLVSRPERLSSKIYKARYFPNDHFFEAELGSSPSFIWRSIWEAKQGLSEATVSSLRTEDGQQWDIEVIENLFNSRDQQCILNTPVGGNGLTDDLFWNEDLNGEYTVRITYRLLQKQKGPHLVGGSSELWSKFWRIKAPPKVLNMSSSEACPFCNGRAKTIIHVLVTCPFASQCWMRRGGVNPSADVYAFEEWLQQILDRIGKDAHGEIVTMCWSIWKAKNQLVWENKRSEVNHVVFSTKHYLAEWNKAQGSSTKAQYRDIIQGDGASSWVRPKQNTVKVTVDAALFAETSNYGFGFLGRDDEGLVVQGKSEVFEGVVRPEFAEAITVKEALSWIKFFGWREVVLESDCLVVVQAIHNKLILRSPFGGIIMECH
ncbi:uncharacterized protein LOC141691038 [Apium graveolens]|uniref:uncharacterized protein LOC141691038 n=1 Tax=Apium graveolens TaxID=4045 RepID=UPI003D7A39CF